MTSPETEVGGEQSAAFTARQALYAALAVVQGQLTTVGRSKTGEVKGQTKEGKAYSYDYKYADLASIADAAYPLLSANGLAFVAGPTMTDQGRFVLRWRLLHADGAELTGDFPLPADAKSPQALGSAITYGRRYCLSAVVGVITSDDDGAAAEYADRHQQHQQTMPPVDNDRAEALTRVQNAWASQYGAWDPVAAGKSFADWSGGEDARTAPHGRLRSFAAYLATLPPEDAGSTPPTEQSAEHRYKDPDAPLSADQRTRIIASLNGLGVKDRQDRLQWMTATLGRKVASTNDLTMAEAGHLIDVLNGGIDVPNSEAAQ